MSHSRSEALDHVVLVLFENRSLDNLLGHLYGPEDGKTFEGVIGKDLSNPIPEWAEHGAERKVVPYTTTDGHGRAEPRLRRGVLPHQHPALQHARRAQPVQDRRGRDRALERPAAGDRADDGRVRHRLHQHLHRRGRPPAHLRGVRPDHDRLHARAGAGAERVGQGLRRLRSLVLRGALPDVHEPLVLDGRDLVGPRGQQPGEEVAGEEHRRDAVRPTGGARPHLEDLRAGTVARLVHGLDPHAAAQGSPGDATSSRSPSSSETRPTGRCRTSA